ncbi:MAG: hypothetical protein ACRBI6_21605 [Acidimicrobiales bacterium]
MKTVVALSAALALGGSACGGSDGDAAATDAEPIAVEGDASAGDSAADTASSDEADDVDGDATAVGDGAADGDVSDLSPYDQSVAAWDAAGFPVPACLAGVYELGLGAPGFLSDDPALCQFQVLDYPGYDDPAPVADVIEAELAGHGLTTERTAGEVEGLPVIEVAATLDDGGRFVAVVTLADTGLPEPELGSLISLIPAG